MSSTSLRSRPLPQELIDLIVVELSGDWRSLEACSITAKCFPTAFGQSHVLEPPSADLRPDSSPDNRPKIKNDTRSTKADVVAKPTYQRILPHRVVGDQLQPAARPPLSNSEPDIRAVDFRIYFRLSIVHSQILVLPSIAGMVMDILTDPHSSLSLSSLKRFNSVVSHSFPLDITQFQRVLDFAAYRSPGFMCLGLGNLNNLRVIHINMVDSVPISLGFAADMLDTVPKRNRLQEIKFTITGIKVLSDLGEDDDYETSWGRLDELLTGSNHLKIRLSLVTMRRSAKDDELRSAVLLKLPKLQSRGFVETQFIEQNSKRRWE
ncbi:hypothetical protein C0995_002992 [Termitomyces sp. Mi166|nr:hypothetical protein C0995_002992 [Termitomyces sp. Mi166\